MRKLFSRQLVEARHEMLSIYEAVDLALHDAVKAYVTDDQARHQDQEAHAFD